MNKIPYYDSRISYSTSYFSDSKVHKYIALFLSNPSNYSHIYNFNPSMREELFMDSFNLFMTKYYIITEKNFDTYAYFTSLNINQKGSVNICGGGGGAGGISRSGKRDFIKKYNSSQDMKLKIRKYLSDKYKIIFDNTKPDPRIFIGHQEIWNNPSPELLKKDNWEWVIDQSYDDETFEKPLPEKLDIDLIPLSIRNKTFNMWKNQQNKKAELMSYKNKELHRLKQLQEEIDDELAHSSKSTTPSSVITTLSTPSPYKNQSSFSFLNLTEKDFEDW